MTNGLISLRRTYKFPLHSLMRHQFNLPILIYHKKIYVEFKGQLPCIPYVGSRRPLVTIRSLWPHYHLLVNPMVINKAFETENSIFNLLHLYSLSPFHHSSYEVDKEPDLASYRTWLEGSWYHPTMKRYDLMVISWSINGAGLSILVVLLVPTSCH